MKIPKSMKLTQCVYSVLEDSAGLILGEFEADMNIDPESMQASFSMDINYPGQEDGAETYPMRFVIEALEEPRNMIHIFAYPQIEISEDRYVEGCILMNRMNARTAWGSALIYINEGQAGIQWKLGMNFEDSAASAAQIHNMVASGLLNISGWWAQYLALANTKMTAAEIMMEHDRQ